MTVRILTGDAGARLRELPDESVHVVCTSPPYFGLRAYGTNPQVWGGDAECPHDFSVAGKNGHGNPPGRRDGDRLDHAVAEHGFQYIASAYCARCGAWRGELGSEPTPEQFVANLVEVFREVKRVLHPSGTLWCNLGDSYAGSGKGPTTSASTLGSRGGKGVLPDDKVVRRTAQLRQGFHSPPVVVPAGYKPKDLMLMPFRVAMALQADGWWLRSAIVWAKKAPMPESVTDRPTSAYELIFLLSKRATYYYDAEAVREPQTEGSLERWGNGHAPRRAIGPKGAPELVNGGQSSRAQGVLDGGRNLRNVWLLGAEPFPESHFATFPTEIPRRAILAGTSERGCCPACLAPWRRQTSTRQVMQPDVSAGRNAFRGKGLDTTNGWQGFPRTTKQVDTLGWQPSCACDAGAPRPCVVLDIFGGSGTTGLVADRLGRDAVLIELNPEYAEMARKRIESDAPMLASVEGAPADYAPLALFGEEAS